MTKASNAARTWAEGRSNSEIRKEISRCDKRYYQPYDLNGTEFAQATIDRITTLERIIEERKI